MANETVTISKEAAEIIDRWFLPVNPNKLRIRAGANREAVDMAKAAAHELKAALRKEG